MNIKKYVFTEAWRLSKIQNKHSNCKIEFYTLLSRQYKIAKLLKSAGLKKFYTD